MAGVFHTGHTAQAQKARHLRAGLAAGGGTHLTVPAEWAARAFPHHRGKRHPTRGPCAAGWTAHPRATRTYQKSESIFGTRVRVGAEGRCCRVEQRVVGGTSALTPALSPKEREKRRLRFGGADGVGRRMVCFVKVAQAVFVAATVKCIRSVTGHSLSPGERARVRASFPH